MKDKIIMWIAWHLPKELVKWCFVRVGANSTYKRPNEEVPKIKMMDALGDWLK